MMNGIRKLYNWLKIEYDKYVIIHHKITSIRRYTDYSSNTRDGDGPSRSSISAHERKDIDLCNTDSHYTKDLVATERKNTDPKKCSECGVGAVHSKYGDIVYHVD